MKKSILTLIAGLGLAMTANAQSTDKGTILLGGNASYNFQKVVDIPGNTQVYSVLPHVGYFLQDHFAIGLGFGYAGKTQKDTKGIKTVSEAFAVSPYVRYYAGSGNVKFFGQLSAPMEWGTSKTGGSKTGTNERYGGALSPGVVFFPGNKVGIEFSVLGLHYDYHSYKPKGEEQVEAIAFGLDANSLKPSIGINFHF